MTKINSDKVFATSDESNKIKIRKNPFCLNGWTKYLASNLLPLKRILKSLIFTVLKVTFVGRTLKFFGLEMAFENAQN